MGFMIYPAIDLLAGRAVRLRQGDPARAAQVGADPVAVARRWEAQGAMWLHVVDLDGAMEGRPMHLELVTRICRAVHIPVQMGGGLRVMDDLQASFDAGVARAVLGTAALAGDVLPAAIDAFGSRIAVALDARDGMIAVEGWRRTSAVPVLDAARRFAAAGVTLFVHTDVARDGMLTGPNLESLRRLVQAVPARVIASGGITSIDDVRGAREAGAAGAIVGRALYEGRLRLSDVVAVAGAETP
jgi:phosphoribosylformimino-5-aminoimidazole carboxamide ribotide isomerase